MKGEKTCKNNNISGFGSVYIFHTGCIKRRPLSEKRPNREDIDVSDFVPEDKWQRMVKALQEEYYFEKGAEEKYKVFDMLFMGNRPIIFKDRLKERSSQILFIIGGADNVTKYESIIHLEPDKHGLSILKLPGIHHFLSIDTHWDRWFPIVNDLIHSFDESASKESLLPNDISHLSTLTR